MTLRGKLYQHKKLSEYTSWKVGGPAERLFIPADLEDLSFFLKHQLDDSLIFFLGNGSNVLIRDAGIKGTVILLQQAFNAVELKENILSVGAGAQLTKIAYFSAENELTGLEFLAGIPGTVGGGLAMNAGAHGGEIWDFVCEVKTINRKGRIISRPRNAFKTSYRHVEVPDDEWFISASFQLMSGDSKVSKEKIKSHLEKRKNAQPLNWPNAGSVFRNPKNDYAARLIEACGLKNYRIGGACVSEKHANFIVNDRNATAKDIESLIEYVEKKVNEKHRVRLIREVKIFG